MEFLTWNPKEYQNRKTVQSLEQSKSWILKHKERDGQSHQLQGSNGCECWWPGTRICDHMAESTRGAVPASPASPHCCWHCLRLPVCPLPTTPAGRSRGGSVHVLQLSIWLQRHDMLSNQRETSWVREMKRLHWAADCHIELNLITLIKGFVFLYQKLDTSRISKQKDDWK